MVEQLKFDDVGTEKKKFHCYKKRINSNEMDVEKTLLSNEFVYG